jgi:HAD superfamily hydrolase (TIGR01509 family)
MSMKYECVIFDCDGTLTDSESLNNQATADVLSELGFPQYTYDVCLNEMVGMTMTAVKKMIEDREHQKLPDDFIERFIRLVSDRMDGHLQPVPHALESVTAIAKHHKTCVASNGERGIVIKSLKAIKLYNDFDDDRIFTKSQVSRGKPFPDLFLYAAEKMGVAPDKCIVVEDSIAGATAGLAAGMLTIGITAVSHDPQEDSKNMKKAGVQHIYQSWPEIVAFIQGLQPNLKVCCG